MAYGGRTDGQICPFQYAEASIFTLPQKVMNAVEKLASWTIRKIFQLRKTFQPWIQYVVGDGLSTFLWVFNWHALGPLYQNFGETVVLNLGRSLDTKVAAIINQGAWKWPRPRNTVTRNIWPTFLLIQSQIQQYQILSDGFLLVMGFFPQTQPGKP